MTTIRVVPDLTEDEIDALRADLAAAPAPPPAEPEGPKKLSLDGIMSLMRAADDAVVEFDLDLDALGLKLREKVDGTVAYRDYCTERSKVLGARAKEMQAAATAFANRADALEKRVAYLMEQDALAQGLNIKDPKPSERYRISGHNTEITLYHSERCVPKMGANAYFFRIFGADLVKREFTWNLTKLKELLAKGHPAAKKFAEMQRNPYIRIGPKK